MGMEIHCRNRNQAANVSLEKLNIYVVVGLWLTPKFACRCNRLKQYVVKQR